MTEYWQEGKKGVQYSFNIKNSTNSQNTPIRKRVFCFSGLPNAWLQRCLCSWFRIARVGGAIKVTRSQGNITWPYGLSSWLFCMAQSTIVDESANEANLRMATNKYQSGSWGVVFDQMAEFPYNSSEFTELNFYLILHSSFPPRRRVAEDAT